jgi:hypothetical protein
MVHSRINLFYLVIEGAYVNTKKRHGKGTDLWAKLGDEIPFC